MRADNDSVIARRKATKQSPDSGLHPGRLRHRYALRNDGKQRGFTLIELVAFMVVVSIALVALMGVFNRAAENNVDPLVQIRALECAQAKLDEILARKFDENTPTGGVPACSSFDAAGSNCAGIVADSDLDDVGDYNGHTDTTKANCSITVEVIEDGTAIGLGSDAQARRINVTATSDGGGAATLSAYKVNF